MTWRRLGVFIRNLPPSSATLREIHGPMVAWGVTDYLLANVVDQLAGANWQRGGGKGRRPKPLPRPKSEQEARERRERMARGMERMRAKHAEWVERKGLERGE